MELPPRPRETTGGTGKRGREGRRRGAQSEGVTGILPGIRFNRNSGEDFMRRLALLLAIVASISLPVAAQNTDIESLSGLQFNFGNPGARALGMGGAFIGLADDASAAEANPAGLTILRKPEISIEGRNYAEQQIL